MSESPINPEPAEEELDWCNDKQGSMADFASEEEPETEVA